MNRFMNMLMQAYREEAGEGDLPGGGGSPAKTYTQAELDEAIAGLKAKNDELIGEKRTAAQKAKEEEQQRILAQQEAAKNSGKLEDFEKTIRGQYEPVIAERDARLKSMQDRILGSERNAVMGKVLSKGNFIDADAADLLSQFVKTEFDGDSVVTKFVGADGNVITTDVEKFVEYCSNHKVISHLMKADAASGGGAGGGKGGGAAKGFAEMSEADRIDLLKNDPAEFERQMKLLRK